MKTSFFGSGSINSLGRILPSLNADTVFLVTGRKSFESSGAREKLMPFLSGKKIQIYDDFSINPKLEDACKGIEKIIGNGSKLVIAIGGGSTIDMAKLVNILSCQNATPSEILLGKVEITKKGRPLIAIPTTAGSGSETTHFSVAYVGGKKYSLSHKYILPTYSIVDPELTYNLPAKLTAVSGFDALSQAVESFWSTRSNRFSKGYAARSIRLIISNFSRSVNAPDRASRTKMAFAAHLAGKAIDITTTTAPHAISYSLTTNFGIPHGHAVALILPAFFSLNSKENSNICLNESRGSTYLKETMNCLMSLFGASNPLECKKKWYELMETVDLETDMKKLGLDSEEKIKKVVSEVNYQRLMNNPVFLNEQQLEEIMFEVLSRQ